MKKQILSDNPWLRIPAVDYENHMKDPSVCQAELLNREMGRLLARFAPERLAVIGSTTGNGFEHIDSKITKKVLAIDINPDYCRILKERFGELVYGLEVLCRDVSGIEQLPGSFDMIHCALVFEYVDPSKALIMIRKSLANNGILTAILQIQDNKQSPVTKTKFESLQKLENQMRLVNPDSFAGMAGNAGFVMLEEELITLETGKSFYKGIFKNS